MEGGIFLAHKWRSANNNIRGMVSFMHRIKIAKIVLAAVGL